jgi:catechol 2,3-dioxygenase-like lactoylglutathione lyase family enzyme
MHDVGLTHVALPVTDLAQSIAFYSRYARMRVVHQRPGAVWISDQTRPFVIVLIEAREVAFPLRPFAHLGVGCDSREEVDRLSALAREEQCLIEGPNDFGPPVGYWAFLRDPDGHTLEIAYGQEIALAVSSA